MIVGIDPGLSGCIAVLDAGPRVVALRPLRIDAVGATLRLVDDPRGVIELVIVERQHAMPRQGRTSISSQMTGYGRILGACEALGLPVTLVEPAVWKRRVGLSLSVGAVHRPVFPNASQAALVAARSIQKRLVLPHARAVLGFVDALPRKASIALQIGAADAVCLALVAAQGLPALAAYRWRFKAVY